MSGNYQAGSVQLMMIRTGSAEHVRSRADGGGSRRRGRERVAAARAGAGERGGRGGAGRGGRAFLGARPPFRLCARVAVRQAATRRCCEIVINGGPVTVRCQTAC